MPRVIGASGTPQARSVLLNKGTRDECAGKHGIPHSKFQFIKHFLKDDLTHKELGTKDSQTNQAASQLTELVNCFAQYRGHRIPTPGESRPSRSKMLTNPLDSLKVTQSGCCHWTNNVSQSQYSPATHAFKGYHSMPSRLWYSKNYALYDGLFRGRFPRILLGEMLFGVYVNRDKKSLGAGGLWTTLWMQQHV